MPLLTLTLLMLAPPPAQTGTKRPPPPPPLLIPTPVPVLAPPRSPPPAPAPAPVVVPGTPARPLNQMMWVTPDDYPTTALRREAEGLVRVRLVIDRAGLPNDCILVASSSHEDLDTATCTLLRQRARFSPALDGDGRPTTGTVIVPVRWDIPDDLPVPVPPVAK